MKNRIMFFIVIILSCLVSAFPTSAVPDQVRQLETIADNAPEWQQKEVFGLWGYTVTDLDQNGRLEIISASLQGTGMYTYIIILEVDEEGTGLSEVRQDREEYMSPPDIMIDHAPVYHDTETGIFYYLFDDFIRNGYAQLYENKRTVSLKDGVWSETMLAYKETLYTDADHFTVSYTDAAGNEIDENRYSSIAETFFGTADWNKAVFNWQTCDEESFTAMDRDALLESLKEALFSIDQ